MATGEANPYDESQFTRPLRLHRRFPRDQLMDHTPVEDGEDNKDREKEEIRRAERLAQREANQAQIAPTEKSVAAKKRPQFKKKVEDVFYPQDTPEAQKRAKLRYEEGRPWHLEDFEGKNTWIGSYEEPLSESHAMLKLEANGSFRMVPLEKWYRFTPTGRYKTMDLDEAEKHMSKKVKESRWFLENSESGDLRRRMEQERQRNMNRGRVGERGESRMVKNEDDDGGGGDRLDVAQDVDEIDFEAEDEFQDDDEGKLFGGDDDEVKESERKIRSEMLGANIFAGSGVKEDKDWDAEEQREKKEADAERRKAKKLRKHLIKREKKYEYESESDHPYSEDSDSESETSEAERLKEEERKKEEEEKAKTNGETIRSGASSAGTNTPAGRSEKHGDPLKNSQLAGASLKRPGSPNLSEASGSESNRKRLKKHRDESGPASRAMSPSVPNGARSLSRKSSSVTSCIDPFDMVLASSTIAGKIRSGAGSGSDTEVSGTERGKTKKLAHHTSPPGSPLHSLPGLRSSSPGPPRLPSVDEIRNAIPVEGITIKDLIKRFRSNIPKGDDGSKAFIGLVKQVGRNAPGGLIMKK